MRAEAETARRAAWLVRVASVLAGAPAVLGGCTLFAPEPAFRVPSPEAALDGTATLAVIGDLQLTPGWVRRFRGREDNREEQRILVADLEAQDRLAALVVVGDLVFSPRSAREWRRLDGLVAPLAADVPVLPVMGNHDYQCWFIYLCSHRVIPREVRKRFPWLRAGEPYADAFGDVALFFLDSEKALDVQAAWLEERLEAARDTFAAAIVFFHRPPFSNSIDLGAKGHLPAVDYIVPVIAAAPLPTIVVNGHIHGYEHLYLDGIHYFTSAGGGGPRGLLGPDRPGDVYPGRDCRTEPSGAVLRPFNYLLVSRDAAGIEIAVRGRCRGDAAVGVLESVRLPLP